MVIDRLFETLDQRMSRWRRTGRQSRLMSSINRSITTLPVISSLGKPLPSSLSPKVKENEVMDERLHIGTNVLCVLHNGIPIYANLTIILLSFISCTHSISDFIGLEVSSLPFNHVSRPEARQYWIRWYVTAS